MPPDGFGRGFLPTRTPSTEFVCAAAGNCNSTPIMIPLYGYRGRSIRTSPTLLLSTSLPPLWWMAICTGTRFALPFSSIVVAIPATPLLQPRYSYCGYRLGKRYNFNSGTSAVDVGRRWRWQLVINDFDCCSYYNFQNNGR